MLKLEDFKEDQPWAETDDVFADVPIENQIEGVVLRRLVTKEDSRGDLTVLLSQLYGADLVTPHAYLVTASAGSVRAWVYHKLQSDRLALVSGKMRVVLYDLRPESSTFGVLNVMDLGASNKVSLTIPPCVVHGVQNVGDTDAHFINLPTRAYDPDRPDKWRLRYDDPRIPYVFS